jgi:hypothetical protein
VLGGARPLPVPPGVRSEERSSSVMRHVEREKVMADSPS